MADYALHGCPRWWVKNDLPAGRTFLRLERTDIDTEKYRNKKYAIVHITGFSTSFQVISLYRLSIWYAKIVIYDNLVKNMASIDNRSEIWSGISWIITKFIPTSPYSTSHSQSQLYSPFASSWRAFSLLWRYFLLLKPECKK